MSYKANEPEFNYAPFPAPKPDLRYVVLNEDEARSCFEAGPPDYVRIWAIDGERARLCTSIMEAVEFFRGMK